MICREKTRSEILAAVREMAAEFPGADYCFARKQFGLLGRIKSITGHIMPTAQQCWEFVGLDRSRLVDEFDFAQEDVARRAAA